MADVLASWEWDWPIHWLWKYSISEIRVSFSLIGSRFDSFIKNWLVVTSREHGRDHPDAGPGWWPSNVSSLCHTGLTWPAPTILWSHQHTLNTLPGQTHPCFPRIRIPKNKKSMSDNISICGLTGAFCSVSSEGLTLCHKDPIFYHFWFQQLSSNITRLLLLKIFERKTSKYLGLKFESFNYKNCSEGRGQCRPYWVAMVPNPWDMTMSDHLSLAVWRHSALPPLFYGVLG